MECEDSDLTLKAPTIADINTGTADKFRTIAMPSPISSPLRKKIVMISMAEQNKPNTALDTRERHARRAKAAHAPAVAPPITAPDENTNSACPMYLMSPLARLHAKGVAIRRYVILALSAPARVPTPIRENAARVPDLTSDLLDSLISPAK